MRLAAWRTKEHLKTYRHNLCMMMMMMITLITIKSSLVPLIEGLCAQIYFKFGISVVLLTSSSFLFCERKNVLKDLCKRTYKYIRICIDTHVHTYILTRNMHVFLVCVRVCLLYIRRDLFWGHYIRKKKSFKYLP